MSILKLVFFLISFQMMANPDFEKAERLFHLEKFVEAQILFEEHLKANPEHTQTLEYLGDIASKRKEWGIAIEYYRKIKEQFPDNANYQYKFGGALGMQAKESNRFKALGMIDDIENAFLTAVKLDVKHIDARWALVVLYLELPGIAGGSEKKAQKYADELMTLSPVDGYLAKGRINEYFKRHLKAEECYKKAHQIGNSKTTFQKLYNLYRNKLKNLDEAERLKKEFEK